MIAKPIICSGINRWQDAKALAQAGAGELYFGVNLPGQMLTVRSEGITARAPHHNLQGLEDLERLCDLANNVGVSLNLLLNMTYTDEQLVKVLKLAEYAYSFGINRFVISDLGLAAKLVSIFPDIKLHASSIMGISTGIAALELKKVGFKRIILPRHFPLDFLSSIESSGMETEVLFYRERCYFDDGHCYFSHSTGNRFARAMPAIVKYSINAISELFPMRFSSRIQEGIFKYFPPENGCMQVYKAADANARKAIEILKECRGLWACGACSLPLMFEEANPYLKIVNRTQLSRMLIASVRFVKQVVDLYINNEHDLELYYKECQKLFYRHHFVHDCGRYCYYTHPSNKAANSTKINIIPNGYIPFKGVRRQYGESHFNLKKYKAKKSYVGIDWRIPWPEWVNKHSFEGVWIGSESCVHDLPSAEVLGRICEEASNKDMRSSLLLPCFTEKVVPDIELIVNAFASYGGNEIIVNDFNGFFSISKIFPQVSLGRLSFPFDIDPRLMRKGSIRFGNYGFNRWTLDIISGHKPVRVYLQPVYPFPAELFQKADIKVGIMNHWMYLSQTYNCPWSNLKTRLNNNPKYIERCTAPCAQGTPSYFLDRASQEYIYFKNAIYYESPFAVENFQKEQSVEVLVHWPPPSVMIK